MDMTNIAIDKLKKELADIKDGDQKISVVKKPVADTLISFCKQDEEFAQAIVESEKTLGDCLKEVMKSVTTAISDIDTYRKAVQYYFPGAGIKMQMTIDLCASVRGNDDEAEPTKSNIVLDLADFL